MEDCLFCKIAAGEIPAAKVFEDDSTIVFRDIHPKAPVHLLAIPREHYVGIHEVPGDKMHIIANLYAAVAVVVKQEGLTDKGYRLVVNFGTDSGQEVPHIHVHILAGRAMQWPPG